MRPFPLLLMAAYLAFPSFARAQAPTTQVHEQNKQQILHAIERLPDLGTLKPSEVFQLVIEDDLLVVQSDLQPMKGESKVHLENMPGFTTVMIGAAGYFKFDNHRFYGEGFLERHDSIFALSGQLNISRKIISLDEDRFIQLIVQAPQPNVPGAASLHVQRYKSTTEEDLGQIHVQAPNILELRRLYVREMSEFVQPIFRDLGQNAVLFSVDERAAWQVFSEDLKPDPKVKEPVKAIVAKLNSDDYREREAASKELEKLGPDAALTLNAIDRAGLSAEQITRIDDFLASYFPLPKDKVAEMRSDVNFLLDCVDTGTETIRAAALTQLRKITGKPVEFDTSLKGDARNKAITALRNQLAPKPATLPAPQPDPAN